MLRVSLSASSGVAPSPRACLPLALCAGIDTACITGRMTRVSGRAGGASSDWSDGTIYPRALRTP